MLIVHIRDYLVEKGYIICDVLGWRRGFLDVRASIEEVDVWCVKTITRPSNHHGGMHGMRIWYSWINARAHWLDVHKWMCKYCGYAHIYVGMYVGMYYVNEWLCHIFIAFNMLIVGNDRIIDNL